MQTAVAHTVPTNNELFDLLAAQHAQIDDLFEFVAMLRDPDALTELADVLGAHLGFEQEALYTMISRYLGRGVVDELEAAHAAVKRVLAELVWLGVEDADFATRLAELRDLLDDHIADQEDELFVSVAKMYERAHALAS
jgi:uncharacterized protein YdcH (DUF465 family)